MLRGASSILERAKPYIILEINPGRLKAVGSSADELVTNLRALDYTVFHINAAYPLAQGRARRTWFSLIEAFANDVLPNTAVDVVAVPNARW